MKDDLAMNLGHRKKLLKCIASLSLGDEQESPEATLAATASNATILGSSSAAVELTTSGSDMPSTIATQNDVSHRGNPPTSHAADFFEARRNEVLEAVSAHQVTIITAPTGSGKSTTIPRLIMEAQSCNRVACTQPRRVAATSLARRVAELSGTDVGELVGYQIGGCKDWYERTRLVYMTVQVAQKTLVEGDGGFTHFIMDEVHCREVTMDVQLNLLRFEILQRDADRKFRLVIMSATMDIAVLKRYFKDFTVKVLDYGYERTYALSTRYLPDGTSANTVKTVAAIVAKEHMRLPLEKDGQSMDFLVFLEGKKAVQGVAEELLWQKPRLDNICIVRVQGGQAVEVQESALQRQAPKGVRKVILATDVVESSVTPPAVDLVIDTLKHKRRRWTPLLQESPLDEDYITKDEAKQRAGRTGRVRAGEVALAT
eukprot:968007-Amphidinium_carterae.1